MMKMESPAADYNGRIEQLHSRYNPQAEAERYIDSLQLSGGIEYIILLEPGLGYLVNPLKNRCNCKIIALHIDDIFRNHNSLKNNSAGQRDGARPQPGIPAWYPGNTESIQEFLEREIPDAPASAVRIIEWRPSLMVYGQKYLNALSEAVDFIKRADAGFRTNAGFGRRWLKNFFKNLKIVHSVLLYKPVDNAMIVTGSGPGLEEAIPRIRTMESQAVIIAASSSLLTLHQGGLRPNLVISTDGGTWAHTHLHSCGRYSMNIQGLAVNLCAALPFQCGKYPMLILNDGSLWQSLILSGLDIPSVIIGQRGTVTASALELALELTRGPVFMAGVDLSVRDILTHARPHSFDSFLYGSASRINPLYCAYFKRAGCNGKSLEIYAAWFKDRLKRWPKRIWTLDKHNTVFDAAPEYNAANSLNDRCPKCAEPVSDQNSEKSEFLKSSVINNTEFAERALRILLRALEDTRYSAILRTELSGLLFSGTKTGSIPEIADELVSVYKVGCFSDRHLAGRDGGSYG